MTIVKRFVLLFVVVALGIIAFRTEVYAADNPQFRADSLTYGFHISDSYEPVYMDNFKKITHSLYKNGNLAGYTEIHQVFLRVKGTTNNYAFAYRVISSPQYVYAQRRVKTTSVLRDLHELGYWAPQNQPNRTTGSIGVGLDSSGPSIQASVDFNHDELTVISRSSVATDVYETEYDFNRNAWEVFWGTASEYMKNDVISFGMFTFTTSSTAWVDISHTIRYTNYPNGLHDVETTISRTY